MIKRVVKAILPYGFLVLYRRSRLYITRLYDNRRTVDQAKFKELLSTAKPIPKTENPETIISLTSYGHRITKTAPLAIVSLFNQTILPDKIILWLAYGEKIPKDLKRLEKIGLKIQFTEDIKSYKKLIPSLKEFPNSNIVTADDDLLYPKEWFKKIIEAHKEYPNNIIAHRNRRISIINNMPTSYNDWEFINETIKESELIVSNTGAGVLFPPNSLDERVFDVRLFTKLTPHADDIWFWAMSTLKGTKKIVVEDGYIDLNAWDLDIGNGLWESNKITGNGNDKQFINLLKKFPVLREKLNIKDDLSTNMVVYDKTKNYFHITNSSDWILQTQIRTGTFYEIDMLKDVQYRLKDSKDNVIIDAGTYIGNHTIFFAQHCNAKKVISFEPFKQSYDILEKNIKLNKLEDRVQTYNIGLGDKKSHASINIVDANNQGANQVEISDNGDISIDTMDHLLLKRLDRLDCIKIDVEGMEIPLLHGALKTIDKFSPLLYIEAFDQDRLNELIKILSPLGYSVVDVFNATPTYLFTRIGKDAKSKTTKK